MPEDWTSMLKRQVMLRLLAMPSRSSSVVATRTQPVAPHASVQERLSDASTHPGSGSKPGQSYAVPQQHIRWVLLSDASQLAEAVCPEHVPPVTLGLPLQLRSSVVPHDTPRLLATDGSDAAVNLVRGQVAAPQAAAQERPGCAR